MEAWPSWIERYIGIPYIECDCWGLVCRIYAEQWGIALPPVPGPTQAARASQLLEQEPDWQAIDLQACRLGDVLALTLGGIPRHCGIVIRPGTMLHTMEGSGAGLERYNVPRWRLRCAGAYRHPQLATPDDPRLRSASPV